MKSDLKAAINPYHSPLPPGTDANPNLCSLLKLDMHNAFTGGAMSFLSNPDLVKDVFSHIQVSNKVILGASFVFPCAG